MFCLLNEKPGEALGKCLDGVPNKSPGKQFTGRANRNTAGIYEAIAELVTAVCEDCVCVYDDESVSCD
jgi:hypothetical protein